MMQETRCWMIAAVFLLAGLFFSGCAGKTAIGPADLEKLDALELEAEATREHIERESSQDSGSDPDAMLFKSLNMLNLILDYADTVKNDPDRFSAAAVRTYSRKIGIINENIKRFKDQSFRFQVRFPLGAYRIEELESSEIDRIHRICRKIEAEIARLEAVYPEDEIKITIKTVGYSDEVDFASPGLEHKILEEIPNPPRPGTPRRQQFNAVLSRLRAVSVNDYIRKKLRDDIPFRTGIFFAYTTAGMGEKIPDGGAKSHKIQDKHRRICIVWPFIEIMLP